MKELTESFEALYTHLKDDIRRIHVLGPSEMGKCELFRELKRRFGGNFDDLTYEVPFRGTSLKIRIPHPANAKYLNRPLLITMSSVESPDDADQLNYEYQKNLIILLSRGFRDSCMTKSEKLNWGPNCPLDDTWDRWAEVTMCHDAEEILRSYSPISDPELKFDCTFVLSANDNEYDEPEHPLSMDELVERISDM